MLKAKNKRGFTLVELLVVVAIVSLMSSLIVASLRSAREKAQVARVKTDLTQLRGAIGLLENDTFLHPSHIYSYPCVQDPEIYLDTCAAGLECTDGGYTSWAGPYIGKVPPDPWEGRYIFDADYTCQTGVEGCEGIPNGTIVRAIYSNGPSGSGFDNYDDNNIVLVLCR